MEFKYNLKDIDIYKKLRKEVCWKRLTDEQSKKALDNSLCIVTAFNNGKPVAMGRVVGDGAVICYIQDLIVIPEFQGTGLGKEIMNKLVEFVKKEQLQDTEIMIDLMCAKGREKFYENNGFISRPNADLGPGMIRYIHKD